MYPLMSLPLENPCWTHILSYLTLADIESVARCHSTLMEIVKSYLRTGHPLVIDQNTLWLYPARTNRHVYSKYGSLATNIELRELRPPSLLLLMPSFPKVQELTIRRMYFPIYLRAHEYARSLFPAVRTLTLIGYREEEKRDLNPLMTNHPFELPYMGALQSLTLIRMTVVGSNCSTLRRLTIDRCWTAIPWEVVLEIPGLEYLRVLDRVDWQQKEQIDSLGVMTVQLTHYSPVPTEENLILALNDDCLLHLQRFLAPDDCISLQATHPRFQHLRVPTYTSDSDSRERRPLDTQREFYERIGPLVSGLDLRAQKVSEFEAEMPFFTNLTELRMTMVEIREQDREEEEEDEDSIYVVVIPRGLCEFRELFQRLNDTLRVLHLDYVTSERCDTFEVNGLSRLTNIVEIRCAKVSDSTEFFGFLEANQATMQSLSLTGEFRSPKSLMQVVSGMRNLRTLHLDCGFFHSPALGIEKGALPLLQTLSISTATMQEGRVMRELLDTLDLCQLKTFRISGCQINSQAVWHRMVSLVELEVDFRDVVPAVFVLTSLQKLRAYFWDDMVLQLVQGLPQLKYLNNDSYKLWDSSASAILEYLRQSKRTLLLNGYRL